MCTAPARNPSPSPPCVEQTQGSVDTSSSRGHEWLPRGSSGARCQGLPAVPAGSASAGCTQLNPLPFVGAQESCCASTHQSYAGSQRGVGSWQSHPAPNLLPAAPLLLYMLRHWIFPGRCYSSHASCNLVAFNPKTESKVH